MPSGAFRRGSFADVGVLCFREMPDDPRIDLYCLCWNDARMLPHFFRHYDALVDRFFVFDNGSTDGSLDILEAHPRVTVRHFDVPGDSFVAEERRLSDTVWRKSRGLADWVIVVDIDEFVFHPDLRTYLNECAGTGVTALRGIGYEMVSETFPTGEAPLTETVTFGARSAGHDKLCIFDPKALVDTRFGPGRHKADPVGRVVWPERPEMLLLHYKQLGVDYAVERSAELRLGLRPGDVEQSWGRQYLWSAEQIRERWEKIKADAAPVPGLGDLAGVPPAEYDEEHAIAASGLLDPTWYLATYPDVAAAGAEAVSHFCIHGWREDRRPNDLFHPAWYLLTYPEAGESGRNPLLHYVLQGERMGAKPSPEFDPAWYRRKYGLSPEQSPLRHYLTHRAGGRVRPRREFTPEELKMNPEFPSYAEVESTLGFDPRALDDAAPVEPARLIELVQLFLRSVPVDEVRYRRAYADVAEALDDGSLPSARQHFIEYGYFEGRSPTPSEVSDT